MEKRNIVFTPEMVVQIIYSMENQSKDMFWEIESRQVVEKESLNSLDKDKYLTLPQWSPADGFQLMERFVSGLNNDFIREELSKILIGDRGVFRSFKNTVKKYPHIESLWKSFKYNEMSALIAEWCQKENVYIEFAENAIEIDTTTEDLIVSEFFFNKVDLPEWSLMSEMALDHYSIVTEELEGRTYHYYICYSPSGEKVGALSFSFIDKQCRVDTLFILPLFRGVGLGRYGIKFLTSEVEALGFESCDITVDENASFITKCLKEANFKRHTTTYRLSTF